jgi:hypothetical protein
LVSKVAVFGYRLHILVTIKFLELWFAGIREEKIFERMRIDDVHFEDYQSMK